MSLIETMQERFPAAVADGLHLGDYLIQDDADGHGAFLKEWRLPLPVPGLYQDVDAIFSEYGRRKDGQ